MKVINSVNFREMKAVKVSNPFPITRKRVLPRIWKMAGKTMFDHVVLCPSLLPQCNRSVHLSVVGLRIRLLPGKCLCWISSFYHVLLFCHIGAATVYFGLENSWKILYKNLQYATVQTIDHKWVTTVKNVTEKYCLSFVNRSIIISQR